MSGYVYRGIRLVAPEKKKTGPAPKAYDPTLCGTRLGYKQHERRDTEKCQPCRDANAAYRQALKAARKVAA